MKLIFSPASPFVRKVRVVIEESGLTDKVTPMPVQTTPLATDPAARSVNPLGKIPVLILDDGKSLFDSRVICRYLNDISGAGLYPSERIWDVLTLEALADGIMDAAVLMVYEARLRDEENRSATWVEAQWEKITHALDALERQEFAAMQGDLNIAHLATACALDYLDFRHGARDWRKGRAALDAWHSQTAQRASLKTTLPSG